MTEKVRDCARTPWWVVRLMEGRLGGRFDLDVCADASNAKASRFITREQDAFETPWSCLRAFCNPPFSGGQLRRFVARAIEQVAHDQVLDGVGIITLGDPSTRYWADLEAAGAERIRLLGRWGCEPPPGITYSHAKVTMVAWILRRTLTVAEAQAAHSSLFILSKTPPIDAPATAPDPSAVSVRPEEEAQRV